MGNSIKCSWSNLSANVFKEFIWTLITFQLHYLPTQSRQPDSKGRQFATPRSGLPSLSSDKREGSLKITSKIWCPISFPKVNTLSKGLGFFPSTLEIQKWAQTPVLINTMVSTPNNINLHGEINDFQARSKAYYLVTAQLASFASQNLIVKKAVQNWSIFSNRWFCKHFTSVPYAKICFSLLLATSSLHLLSSFATFFSFFCRDVQIWKFWGVVGVSEGVFYHPSWRAGALPGDVVADASVLARAPLLALWAMLPGGTQVLTAVHRVGTAHTPVTTGPRFVPRAIISSSSGQNCVEHRAMLHREMRTECCVASTHWT